MAGTVSGERLPVVFFRAGKVLTGLHQVCDDGYGQQGGRERADRPLSAGAVQIARGQRGCSGGRLVSREDWLASDSGGRRDLRLSPLAIRPIQCLCLQRMKQSQGLCGPVHLLLE
ncbi:hypothetical protein GCM10009414_06530 [Tatumella terrea]